MKVVIIFITAFIFTSCGYIKQTRLIVPTSKLIKNKSVIIATPMNGSYDNKEYSASGKMTSIALRAAFAKFTNEITILADCKDLACLKENQSAIFDYYIVPEILQWVDRATEWSGLSDVIEIKIIIYDGKTFKEFASVIIKVQSKWLTMGGDHPQDLLEKPINSFIESLY